MTNDISHDARMHRICGTLAENGFQVSLVGRLKSSSVRLSQYNFDTERLVVAKEKGFFFYMSFNVKLFRYLLKSDAEVICSVDADTLLAGRLASWLTKKELVYDAHELFTELPELSGKPIRKLIWKLINRIGLWGNVRCYTVNQELATLFSNKYNKPFISIQNVPHITSDKRSSQTLDKPIKLVYVGMINKGRGIEEAIDFVTRHDKYELHILGNGDLYDKLMNISSKQSRVIWHGFQTHENIKRLLPNFHIGLNLLSADSKNYYYSSANKFFDYVNACLPVLSMNFPVYRRLCLEFKVGELIDNLTEINIKYGLQNIESNYAAFSVQCEKAKKIWNWQNEEEKLLSFYMK